MSVPPPSERILIVDDEDQIRALLARLLSAHGYQCLIAESAAAARCVLEETDVSLVLSDVNMPGESGIDFTREVLARYPDTAVVMGTGMDDRSYADAAIELGAYGYVLKPFKPNELIINVGNALRRRALEIESRSSRERLEQTVLERTAALRDTIAQLETSDAELRRLREETIRRLSWAAEFRNQETGEHIVGTGYPGQLAGEAIPIEGRICAVADVFDALTSDRVYRQAFQPDEARTMMLEGRGTQFDAELLDLFFDAYDEVLAIRREAGTSGVDKSLSVALAHSSRSRTGSSG